MCSMHCFMSGLSYLSRKVSFVSFTCRSSSKPPLGKPNRKDHRKRNRPEDDELDPMDPSSYSDAPRGGWYMTSLFLLNDYPVEFHKLSWCLPIMYYYFSFVQPRKNVCIINYVPLYKWRCTLVFAGLLVWRVFNHEQQILLQLYVFSFASFILYSPSL